MNEDLVLVTGGSGFLGIHCIDQLLRAGYNVRTTVRSSKREVDVRAMLANAGTLRQDALKVVVADLSGDAGWPEAVSGCRYVLHVASPVPGSAPKHEDEVIVPARDGTLRVLRAARDAGVQRVVLTSSVVAVVDGQEPQAAPFDETSWTNVDAPGVIAYSKSKTLAERAAWDFIGREGGKLELSVINPGPVFGPTFGPDFSASIDLIKRLLDGFPACPRLYFTPVDVRDVADIHLRAMTNLAANGQRFVAGTGGLMSFLDISLILREHMPDAARRAPTRELPGWLVRVFSLFMPELKLVVPDLGKRKAITSEKATRLLGWTPRSNEEAITASGESLVRLGLLKN